MEVGQLPPNVAKVTKNFRCLLVGASETGKSTFIANLIKHKEEVFQKPGYTKFVYCSPNLGDSALTSSRDVAYQNHLKEAAEQAEIRFLSTS